MRVFAVPRSMARSLENMPQREFNTPIRPPLLSELRRAEFCDGRERPRPSAMRCDPVPRTFHASNIRARARRRARARDGALPAVSSASVVYGAAETTTLKSSDDGAWVVDRGGCRFGNGAAGRRVELASVPR